MGSDWLRDHHAAMSRLQFIQDTLESLARAFGMTGNQDMRESMYHYAEEIGLIRDQAQDAISTMLTSELAESRRDIGMTLKTLLDAASKK